MRALWHALHDHLVRSTETFSFQKQFLALRRSSSALQSFADPAALLDHLHAPGGIASERNAVLRGLVVAAQRRDRPSDAATTLMLLALWPGLDAVHRRLSRHFRQNPEDLVSEISERATCGIRKLDLDRVTRIAATVIRNTERDIRRALRSSRKEEASRSSLREDLQVDDLPPSTLGLAPGLEADAATEALIRELRSHIGTDADLLVSVAVVGERQHEAASRLGIGHEAVRKRYQRAIRRVRLHLEEIA